MEVKTFAQRYIEAADRISEVLAQWERMDEEDKIDEIYALDQALDVRDALESADPEVSKADTILVGRASEILKKMGIDINQSRRP